jgi:transposase
LIINCIEKKNANQHVLSVDEKTGIQALERYEQRSPESRGYKKRKEYEYIRHGTSTLMATVNVENGKVFSYHQGQTRDENDYSEFIKKTVNKLPELDRVIILADQLNTHVSESLVKWIAQLEEYHQEELGEKGKSGILKNMESRRLFLERSSHRVRFIFTPKHCSWLNPIENWFSKLQKHILKNGNFTSVPDLETKISAYIKFHNIELARTINWKFKGFTKCKILRNIYCQKLTG